MLLYSQRAASPSPIIPGQVKSPGKRSLRQLTPLSPDNSLDLSHKMEEFYNFFLLSLMTAAFVFS